jgi:hypothetical protein
MLSKKLNYINLKADTVIKQRLFARCGYRRPRSRRKQGKKLPTEYNQNANLVGLRL